MGYFLPSFVQKRILRYALSRLDLLDTDTLDLDKLDIVWGKRSTVELRDVGLRLKRLSSLLQLPSYLKITKAKVLLLRVTIPADIYSSGILVEVEGVEGQVFLTPEPSEAVDPNTHVIQRGRLAKGIRAYRPRSVQPAVPYPGKVRSVSDTSTREGDDAAGGAIPTSVDLAQSFLETELLQDRTKLQAAISKSQHLQQSQSSEDGEENSDPGLGATYSLPGFIADFLKGVGDRLKLQIRKIQLDIDLEVEVPLGGATTSSRSKGSDIVTLRVAIDSVNIDDVDCRSRASKEAYDGENSPTLTGASGNRCISFTNVQIMLVSDSLLFNVVSQSSEAHSPTATHSSAFAKRTDEAPRNSSDRKSQASSSKVGLAMAQSAIFADTGADREARATQTSFIDNNHIINLEDCVSKRCETPNSPEQSAQSSLLDTSHSQEFYSERGFSPDLTDRPVLASSEIIPTHDCYESLYEENDTKPSPERIAISNTSNYLEARSTGIPLNGQRDAFASRPYITTDYSTDEEQSPRSSFHGYFSQSRRSKHSRRRSPSASVSSSATDPYLPAPSAPASDEDLTQSKIFSNDEAKSMYLSAISQVSTSPVQKARVPGGWDAFRSDSGDPPSVANESNKRQLLAEDINLISVKAPHANFDHASHERGSAESSTHLRARPESQQPSVSPLEGLEKSSDVTLPMEFEDAKSQKSEASSGLSTSSTRTVKRFVTIDSVVIRLPQQGTQEIPYRSGEEENLDAKGVEIPGAFSTSPLPQSTKFNPKSTSILLKNQNAQENQGLTTKSTDSQPISVSIHDVAVFGDLGLTRLMVMIAQQVSALQLRASVIMSSDTESSRSSSSTIVDVERLSWKFVDLIRGSVEGVPDVDLERESLTSSSKYEVLLVANLDNLKFTHKTEGPSSHTKLSFGKVTFGYPSDHIISFASDLRMRESTRDVLAPVNKDLELSIIRTPKSLMVNATTLPLHIVLDLVRLDETFSWFGGLSTVLGLGNSMISTVTAVDTKTKASSNAKRPRGVRFDTPGEERRPFQTATAQQKITLRVGGLLFDLTGKESFLRLEGSAIKMVSRDEGIGVQLDKLKFGGPYLRHMDGAPAVSINFGNIRIEYLPIPTEVDLARLLALLSPSRARDEPDDDILLDTFLRQRQQGAVVRLTVGTIEGIITKLHDLAHFSVISRELAKLSTVAKYLPEDDRPGLLSLVLVRELNMNINLNNNFGAASIVGRGIEIAHVTLPSLVLFGVNKLYVHRQEEELIGEVLSQTSEPEQQSPMIMARFIGNEMEPTLKFKLWNLRVEYHVSTIMAILGISETTTGEIIIADMVSSIATLTERQPHPKPVSEVTESSENSTMRTKPLRFEVMVRDSIIGLNPRLSSSKGLIVLSNTRVTGTFPKKDDPVLGGTIEIRKASLMVIDSIINVVKEREIQNALSQISQRTQIQSLIAMGYVAVSDISAAKISWQVVSSGKDGESSIDIEVRDDLFVLETCADSTQTLQSIFSGLQPPMPPSQEIKYRTEVVPVEDMLASFTGDAFATTGDEGAQIKDDPLGLEEGDLMDDDVPQNLEYVSSFYDPNPATTADDIANSILEGDLGSLVGPPITREIGDKPLLQSFQEQYEVAPGSGSLDFNENYFGADSRTADTAQRWDSDRNAYELSFDYKIQGSPLRIRVRDVHIIWNLFDGYDWQHTRDTISQAVADVETKAAERLARKDNRKSVEQVDEEESVIGDFLFNSIYIGIPANQDPRDLSRQVNRNIDDLVSEAESYATTTTIQGSPSRQGHAPRTKRKRLRLQRSKHHKMTFELKGLAMDLVVFPPMSGETQSSIDIRVQDLDIFDHVPTSTWKKFATYMREAGERQSGSSMVHIEILNVRPVPELAASEIILKATILPLRLHVDQDALDFMTRFFEFKDDSAPIRSSKAEVPFIQRAEINSVQVKLDFKPKRVDYAGLRSGRTTEFMNFFILDQADMVLRHVIIYGVSGFDKLGKTLNDIWMPDIKRNQLPGVLAGLAPVRSLVNVGESMKNLVVIPIREYRKDGRVVRSIQKGALSFAKTTTTELAKFGAKLAIGTQTVLQGAEDYLVQPSTAQRIDEWEGMDLDDEKKYTSPYAIQPEGLLQGLRGGIQQLERDLLMAKDAIIAIPGEVMESRSAAGAARAVLKGAPTMILRPALGVTKAVGQTLMGATNSLDKGEKRRVADVSTDYPLPTFMSNFLIYPQKYKQR
ncbi:autophagy- protein 2 [Xylographa bjoerkii]|nr:autophagy- protein 2 [Xylographa bjoerkii]